MGSDGAGVWAPTMVLVRNVSTINKLTIRNSFISELLLHQWLSQTSGPAGYERTAQKGEATPFKVTYLKSSPSGAYLSFQRYKGTPL